MTPELVATIDALFEARVPNKWLYDPSGAEISWMAPDLGAWFTGFDLRNT